MSATTPPVGLPSTIHALSGPALTALAPWGILLLPTLALTAYQEIGVPYSSDLARILVCVLPSAGAAVVFLIARALRRTTHTIPLGLCIALWLGVGILHGVIGGLAAQFLAGSAPHYLARVAFWAAVSLIWFPLVTYLVAQFSYRRDLATSLQSELRREQAIRRGSMWELAELRDVIVRTIRDHIRPELVEITRSLESIGPALDSGALAALGSQLAEVSEETTRIIDTATSEEARPFPTVRAPQSTPPTASALEFVRGQPFLVVALITVDLLPLVVNVSFGTASIDETALVTEALCTGVVMVLLLVGIALLSFTTRLRMGARIGWTLTAFAVAGIAAASVALFGPWQPASQQNVVLAALLPFAVPLAASALGGALGLALTNIETLRQIRGIEGDIAGLGTELDQSRDDIRRQVAAVTHGPLRGRLAACAMALNFHAAEIGKVPPERTDHIIASVREHLSDVLNELDSLG